MTTLSEVHDQLFEIKKILAHRGHPRAHVTLLLDTSEHSSVMGVIRPQGPLDREPIHTFGTNAEVIIDQLFGLAADVPEVPTPASLDSWFDPKHPLNQPEIPF